MLKKTSQKQIEANRRNAAKSTGPRTSEGKARSRYNALKHGILAKAVIPEPLGLYESKDDMEFLVAGLRETYAPATPIEELMVERIAATIWRLTRVSRVEGAAIAIRQDLVEYDLARQEAYESGADDAEFWFKPGLLAKWIGDHEAIIADGRPQLLRAYFDAPEQRAMSDEDLQTWANEQLQLVQDRLVEMRQRRQLLARAEASLPKSYDMDKIMRYETTLDRQLQRQIDSLRRVQQTRLARGPLPLGEAQESSSDA